MNLRLSIKKLLDKTLYSNVYNVLFDGVWEEMFDGIGRESFDDIWKNNVRPIPYMTDIIRNKVKCYDFK